jgi:deaminated glutathione amidase
MKKNRHMVAAIQLASGPRIEANLLEVERLLEQAAERDIKLAVLPENFAFMGKNDQEMLAIAEEDGDGPLQRFLAQMAKRYGLWLVGGTVPIRSTSERVRAACLVYDKRGTRRCRYDKIHLFDADLPSAGEHYRESKVFEPGAEAITLDSPFGRLGLVVCYDLRFPELFRRLMDQNVEIFCMPAAFTALTGKSHWEVLVRARAIENLSYVIAAAQGGFHHSGRQTYGHSMIVNPWGSILAEAGSGSGLITAALDLDYLKVTRQNLPALQHRHLGQSS